MVNFIFYFFEDEVIAVNDGVKRNYMSRVSKNTKIYLRLFFDLSYHIRLRQVHTKFCGSLIIGELFDFSMIMKFLLEI